MSDTPCPCTATKDFMRSLGMTTAAMHSGQDGDPLVHMSEEEINLFPLLRAHGFNAEVDLLLRQHTVFRNEIRQTGSLNRVKRLWAEHAAFEDRIIGRLIPKQLSTSRRKRSSR